MPFGFRLMTSKPTGGYARKQVEALPFLGRSWYKRGVSYWIRRALITFMMVVAFTILALITGGLVDAIVTSSMPVWERSSFWPSSLRRSCTAYGAAGVFNMANRAARKRGVAMTMAEAAGEPKRGARDRQRRAVAGSAGLGALAMLGGGALLVISVPFNVGWGVVAVLASCQKYFSPEEFAAWQKIERERKKYG